MGQSVEAFGAYPRTALTLNASALGSTTADFTFTSNNVGTSNAYNAADLLRSK